MLLAKLGKVGNSRYQYVPLLSRQRVRRPNVQDMHSQTSSLFGARQILIDNFKQKKDATSKFLPKLLASITWAAIKQFQSHPAEVASNVEHICTSCDLFIPIVEVTWLQW